MKKNMVVRLIVCISAMALLFLVAPVYARELNYSSFYSPAHPFSKLADEWCKEVEKRTEGRVVVRTYHGATLTPMSQTYDSVTKGIADVGLFVLGYAPGRFPLTEVLTLPLGFKNGYQATKCANAYFKKFNPKEFSDVKVMYLLGSGPGFFHTRKVISSIDDVKGLRIKANAEITDIAAALGAVPVIYSMTEVYDALTKGVLDGELVPMEAMRGFRHAEVLKCTIENYSTAYTTSQIVVMNKNTWNAISKKDQEAIEKINEEWIEKQGKGWSEGDVSGKKFAIEKGMKIVRSSEAEEAATAAKMKPIIADYVKKTKNKGLPGEEALKFVQNYLSTH